MRLAALSVPACWRRSVRPARHTPIGVLLYCRFAESSAERRAEVVKAFRLARLRAELALEEADFEQRVAVVVNSNRLEAEAGI
jgi:hypothetical protein